MDFSHSLKGVSQARLKKVLCCLSAAFMAIWRGDQLLRLWCNYSCEKTRIQVPDRPPQPHIKIVAKVCIADVVVVGRIGGNNRIRLNLDWRCRVKLLCVTGRCCRQVRDHESYPLNRRKPVCCRITEGIAFAKVPCHLQSLSSECATDEPTTCRPGRDSAPVITAFV